MSFYRLRGGYYYFKNQSRTRTRTRTRTRRVSQVEYEQEGGNKTIIYT